MKSPYGKIAFVLIGSFLMAIILMASVIATAPAGT